MLVPVGGPQHGHRSCGWCGVIQLAPSFATSCASLRRWAAGPVLRPGACESPRSAFVVEAGVVGADASIADAAVADGDEPGEGALDEGPASAVVAGQIGVKPPPNSVGDGKLVVFGDGQGLGRHQRDAALPDRAASAHGAGGRRAGLGEEGRDLVGAGDGADGLLVTTGDVVPGGMG